MKSSKPPLSDKFGDLRSAAGITHWTLAGLLVYGIILWIAYG